MTVYTSSRAKSRSLATFFILAFAISWAIEIPLALEARGVINTPIPFSFHYLAALGPLMAAIITTWLATGHHGLRDLGRRMFMWRVPVRWWLAAFAPLLLFVAVVPVLRLLLGRWPDFGALGQIDFLPYQGLAALLWWIVTFGLGEETGWRGFALPRLQRDHSAFRATIILWFFWALWHLPMFFYLYDVTILAGFLIGLLAGSITLTWFYNSTGGSILLAAVWHGTFNFVTGCVSCKTSIAAAFISTLVMVLAVVILVKYKPATLSASKNQVPAADDI